MINPPTGGWQVATLEKSELIAVNVKALTFRVANWQKHQSGQHYDIRLTAPGGYVAERSYSAASPPEQTGEVEFGIQLLDNGEVSPYLWQLEPGGQIEIRGPIGGHFVWCHTMPGTLVLIGGGSGLVPLMAMLRHWENTEDRPRVVPRSVLMLGSFRTLKHILYRAELEKLAQENKKFCFVRVLTEVEPRIDENKLREVVGGFVGQMPMIYVCGPTKFVEVMASSLVKIGFNSHEIRTERFG